MGTRGAYGYRLDGKNKVTYNHFDSYPDELGTHTLSYAANMGIGKMKKTASNIIMVDSNSTPSPELIERYKAVADIDVAGMKYEDWYCLLRNTQGDLRHYHKGIEHMIDSHEFLADSLFCEWAYIINLDNQQFEIYRGFNKNPNAPGRYAGSTTSRSNGYVGVSFIASMPLDGLTKKHVSPLIQMLNAYENAECVEEPVAPTL
jgi:hypothetical protein